MSKYIRPKPKIVVSDENAHEQIMLLVDKYDLYPDEMDDKEKAEAVEDALDHVKKAIVRGEISVEDREGELHTVLHIRHKSEDGSFDKLVFREMRQRDHVKMSEKQKNNQHGRMNAIMASMCVEPKNGHHAVGMLRASDASNLEWLSTLFL